jgi:RNA polymerase sigma-70 factor (ECF subfamily)
VSAESTPVEIVHTRTIAAELLDVRGVLERAQDGDPQAFRQLHDRYAAPVRRFVASRVPESLADDLTNETFLRAWRALSGFRWQDRDPLAWLLTIARNLIADHWSLLRNRLEVPSDDITPVLRSNAPAADDEVFGRAEAERLRAAIAKLPPAQRRCVELRFLAELSVRETAVAMGRQDTAVRALQHRALRSLAVHVERRKVPRRPLPRAGVPAQELPVAG